MFVNPLEDDQSVYCDKNQEIWFWWSGDLWVNNALLKLKKAWFVILEPPKPEDKRWYSSMLASYGLITPSCLGKAKEGLLVHLSKEYVSSLKCNQFRHTFIYHDARHGLLCNVLHYFYWNKLEGCVKFRRVSFGKLLTGILEEPLHFA